MCRKKRNRDDDANENSSGGGFLGFLGFLVTIACTVVYIVEMIMQFVGKGDLPLVRALQYVAGVLSLVIVGIVGWRFVRSRSKWLRFVYILLIIIVAVCMIAGVTWLFR